MKMIQTGKNNSESGIVAILVVVIFTGLLALISLGFSHLMNREARQALDRQLSLQSYYSAESGLNDAKAYLIANPNAALSNGCAPPNAAQFVTGGDISGDSVAKYSCVIINSTPPELIFSLKVGESRVFKIDVPNMANMYFSWQNNPTPSSYQPLGNFRDLPREDQLPSPDATGILRTGLYAIPKGGGVISNANATLTAASRNYFMYPDAGNGTVGTISTSSTDDGQFVHGYCNANIHPVLPFAKSTPRYCNSEVTGPPGSRLDGNAYSYYVRLSAVYAPISVSIQVSDSNNASLQIPNVEGIVDITGTGNDVLSRIQARVPLTDIPFYPSFGIQSMQALCKAFRITADTPTQSTQQPSISGIPNNDGACEQPFNAGALTGGAIPPYDDVPCGTNAIRTSPTTCVCAPGWSPNPTPYVQCDPPPPPPPANSCHIDRFDIDPNATIHWAWHCDNNGDPSIFGRIAMGDSGFDVGQGGDQQLFGSQPSGTCFGIGVGTGDAGTTDFRISCVP